MSVTYIIKVVGKAIKLCATGHKYIYPVSSEVIAIVLQCTVVKVYLHTVYKNGHYRCY